MGITFPVLGWTVSAFIRFSGLALFRDCGQSAKTLHPVKFLLLCKSI